MLKLQFHFKGSHKRCSVNVHKPKTDVVSFAFCAFTLLTKMKENIPAFRFMTVHTALFL